jgi:hypothetical protein
MEDILFVVLYMDQPILSLVIFDSILYKPRHNRLARLDRLGSPLLIHSKRM